jgi:hypothetical protein
MLRAIVGPGSATRAASGDGSAAEAGAAVGIFGAISAATTDPCGTSVCVHCGLTPAGVVQPGLWSGGNVGRQERDPLPLTRSALSGGAVGPGRIGAPRVEARQERLHG